MEKGNIASLVNGKFNRLETISIFVIRDDEFYI